MLAAAALAPWAYIAAERVPGPAFAVALAGAGVLAAGVAVRRGALVTAGLALVGTGYGTSVVDGDLAMSAALGGGVLVLAAELAYWAIEPGARVTVASRTAASRLGTAGALALAGAALGALLVTAALRPLAGGVVLGVAGFVALGVVAVAAIALLESFREDGEP